MMPIPTDLPYVEVLDHDGDGQGEEDDCGLERNKGREAGSIEVKPSRVYVCI